MKVKNHSAMFILNEICDVLDTYRGRDKFLRTLCYTMKLLGHFQSDKQLREKLNKFGSIMSQTRATLRLFDDLPMLKYNIDYGFGEKEPDKLLQAIGVTNNVIDTLFYPIEKVSWFAEHELIEKDGTAWDVASTICWVATTYLSLIRTVRQYSYLSAARQLAENNNDRFTLLEILNKQKMEILTGIRLVFDLVHSVQCLPAGFLWSAQLKPWQTCLVGTISSFLGIYQLFAKRALSRRS